MKVRAATFWLDGILERTIRIVVITDDTMRKISSAANAGIA